MHELIKIQSRDLSGAAVQTCDARELHAFLEVQTAFKDWIARRVAEYGFSEGADFCSFLSESQGGRPAKEYALTIDMAKELAMVERNEKGKQARQYFIACERIAVRAAQESAMARFNVPQTYPEAMRLAADLAEGKAKAEADLAIAAPKAEALDRLADADGLMNPTVAAKTLQVPPKKLFDWLRAEKWIYRRAGGSGNVAYQDKIQSGYLTHKITTVERDDGSERVCEQVMVTPKGLAKLAQAFRLH